MNPRLKLIRWQRSLIQVRRKWNDEHLGGSRVRSTCQTCGYSVERDLTVGPKGRRQTISPTMVAKLVRYWNGCSGSSAICPRCTKKLRDERFPLPKENQ